MTTRFTVLPTACATGLTSPSTCPEGRVSEAPSGGIEQESRESRAYESSTLKANSLYV